MQSTRQQIEPGCPVFSSDGEHLGRVKEVSGQQFKVDVPMGPDYWLDRDGIASVRPGDRLVLRYSRDDVDEVKMDGPRSGPYGSAQRYAGGQQAWRGNNESFATERAGYQRYDQGGAWGWENRSARPGQSNRQPGRSQQSSVGASSVTPAMRSYPGDVAGENTGRRDDQAGYEAGFWRDHGQYQPRGGGPWAGLGPSGYRRSDERIRDEVCELLWRNGDIDARDMEVEVADGAVSLSGSVGSRYEKRLAEDLAESVAGVQDVQNRLKALGR